MLKRSLSKRFNWEKLSAQLRTLTSRCLNLVSQLILQSINTTCSLSYDQILIILREKTQTHCFELFLYQVVSRESMPKSMLEQYLACDKPPPLDKLNPYRWNIHKTIFYLDVFWLLPTQGGWKRRTEVLHGCKLFLRSVALRNAAVHREG